MVNKKVKAENSKQNLGNAIVFVSDLDNYSDIVLALNSFYLDDCGQSITIISKHPSEWFEERYKTNIRKCIRWQFPCDKMEKDGLKYFVWAAKCVADHGRTKKCVFIEVGSSIVIMLSRVIGFRWSSNLKMYSYILSPTKIFAGDVLFGRNIFSSDLNDRWYYRRILRQAMLDAVGNIFADGFLINAAHLIGNYTYGRKCFFVPNPIKISGNLVKKIRSTNEIVRLYYAGRVEPAKGIGDVFRLISKSNFKGKIFLTVIGKVDPFYSDWFQQLSKESGINFNWMPHMGREEYLEKVFDCDGLLFLSYYEGASRVVEEAVAMNKFVIIGNHVNSYLESPKIMDLGMHPSVEGFDISVKKMLDAAKQKTVPRSGYSNYLEFVSVFQRFISKVN